MFGVDQGDSKWGVSWNKALPFLFKKGTWNQRANYNDYSCALLGVQSRLKLRD